MDKLINRLLNYSLSPYEFIRIVKKNNGRYTKVLRKYLTSHSSAYIRLCCAWALGELQNKDSFNLLKRAYLNELEDNARANIVWALFWIDGKRIMWSLFNKFLRDTYYLVKVIALKNIAGLHQMAGKADFIMLYNRADNLLVKLELLRNIRSFRFPDTINSFLLNELKITSSLLLKMELMNAIAVTKRADSLNILIDFYNVHKKTILHNENLAYYYVSALLSLGQSKPHTILFEIYTHNRSSSLKWKTIELLATAGGPKCLEVLKKLYSEETDLELKKQIQSFIEVIPITVP